jgi:hypothetical protein
MAVILGSQNEDDERGETATYLWKQLIADELNGI